MYLSGLGEAVVAHVSGDLTAGRREALTALLDDALARGERDVVVNLGGVGYLDGATLGLFVRLARRTRARGGQFAVANVTEEVRTLLELTRLDTVLSITTLNEGPAD